VDKFIKRIQTRLSAKGLSVTKSQVREAYKSTVGKECWENPTEEQVSAVVTYITLVISDPDLSLPSEGTLALSDQSFVEVSPNQVKPIPQPEIYQVPVENLPCLQPPTPQEKPEESALAQTIPSALETSVSSSSISKVDVTGIVKEVFASQPSEVQEKISEYALQQTFANVRQIQTFLEELRGMEFNLMVETMRDHFERRGGLMTELNNLIDSQQSKDEGKRSDFFDQIHNRMQQFQVEMSQKLAKQNI
jgi:hypothetical protein